MSSSLREHTGAILWSVALHAAVIAALAFGADFMRRPPEPEVLAIQAMVVDETLLARVDHEREEAERQAELERQRREAEAERQRQAELERQRREAEAERQRQAEAERQRQEAEAERQRQAELERQRQEAERQRQAELERQRREAEAERQRQAELERQRQEAEAERQRQAELERRRREEEAERQRQAELERQRREEAERRRQAELEAQLAAELEREAERLAAMRSGALDEYRMLLKNRIEQNWIRPPSARPGINCTVHVTQIPSGEVISARVTSCNGDDAVVRSIEAAVLRASPLPLPSDRSLFERNLIIDFVPED